MAALRGWVNEVARFLLWHRLKSRKQGVFVYSADPHSLTHRLFFWDITSTVERLECIL